MKNLSLFIGAITLIGFAAYVGYEVYLPQLIATSIIEKPASFVPDRIQNKLERIRKPVNEGAKIVVETAHKSGVTMEQILKAIDATEEKQALAFLDELNKTKIENPNQVFSMAKRHFPVEFDVEIFRSVFNERVDMAMIKKGVRYANMYKNKDEFDSETAKSIAKEILLQKEDEFKKITNVD